MTTQHNKTRNPTKQHAKSKKTVSPNTRSARSKGAQSKQAQGRKAQLAPNVTGKIGMIVELLKKPKGASLDDLCAATGWQPHSVRGALSGTIKKKLGLPLLSEKTDKGRIYRIAE